MSGSTRSAWKPRRRASATLSSKTPLCPSAGAKAPAQALPQTCWTRSAATISWLQGDRLDLAFAANSNTPVIARLYDLSGVLLGESFVPGVSAGAFASRGMLSVDARREAVPTQPELAAIGQQQSRLTVDGLNAGGFYMLQLLTPIDAASGAQELFVEVSAVPNLVYLPIIRR